jgi:hypothetical protein
VVSVMSVLLSMLTMLTMLTFGQSEIMFSRICERVFVSV